MIPIFSNSLGMEELDAVADVMRSRWVGKGKECSQFETELEGWWNVEPGSVLLFNCCTSALQIILRAIGIEPGDEVVISTINFVACASAVMELGARPVFTDVYTRTPNICLESLERVITPRTKVVIVLHYGGHPCEMRSILDICKHIPVIEDAACAPASVYGKRACGTIGFAGVWSFDAMKILCMGDGGALWCSDFNVLDKARVMRYLGMNAESGTSKAGHQDKWWQYEVEVPSGRYISNDILASIGRQQLKKLPEFVKRRKEIWDTYQDQLRLLPMMLPPEVDDTDEGSYYLYWIQTDRRDELAKFLYGKKVYSTFRYWPLHRVKAFGHDGRHLVGAEMVANTTLCLPVHQNLKDSEVEYIVDSVREFFK